MGDVEVTGVSCSLGEVWGRKHQRRAAFMKIHHKLPCAYHWVKPAAGREVERMAFSL